MGCLSVPSSYLEREDLPEVLQGEKRVRGEREQVDKKTKEK